MRATNNFIVHETGIEIETDIEAVDYVCLHEY